MFGLLSTLQVGTGSQLVPVSCPIVFVPLGQMDKVVFGLVREGHPKFAEYRKVLNTAICDDFCRFRE